MQVQLEQVWKFVVAIGGGIVSSLWGGWTLALETLLVFVIVDYITGVIAGFRNGELSSKRGFKGILTKVAIFCVVAVAHKLDQILSDGHFFRDTIIFFYLSNELLSIVENVGKAGVPFPEEFRKAVEILRGKEKEKQYQNFNKGESR